MMKIFKSVRFRLLILSLLAVFVITSIVVLSDTLDTNKRLIAAQKEKAVLLSDTIKQSIMLLMLEKRWKELQKLLEDLSKSNPELKNVRIFHPSDGHIIFSNEIEEVGKKIYKEDWDRFVKNEESPFVIKKQGNMFATRVVSIKNMPPCYRCHPPEQKTLGVLDVEISLAVAQESIRVSTYKHITGLVLGFVVISLVFLIGGEKLINTPLKELINVMKKVESGDLSVRVEGTREDEFGYLSGAFNHMIDALESAKKEIERYHTQQMERAAKLASLGEIISGIAHEIKNPLAGISCAVQVFNSELANDDSRKPVITEVLNQVKRLDRIVKDLLSYAKPKTPVFVPSKIQDVLEKTLFFVYSKAKNQHIAIDNQVSKELPDILMDPDQMQQVFMNIIINAIQSMPNGGILTISVSRKSRQEVEDSIKRPIQGDPILTIRIQDTGSGISPEDLPYIFEPFFTKKTKGTGLGLSISRKIVQDHGGDITVESEVGKGSAFTVYLPMRSS